MVIEFNLQLIMILPQQERQLYVEMGHIVLAGIEKERALITGESPNGYNHKYRTVSIKPIRTTYYKYETNSLYYSCNSIAIMPNTYALWVLRSGQIRFHDYVSMPLLLLYNG